MRNLYNEEVKKEYLSTIENTDARNITEYLFRKSKNTELFYGKDLYSFDLSQIEQVVRNTNPKTLNSVANTKSRINLYIAWAIKNGRRLNNINPLHGTSKEWESKFIYENTIPYLSESEIYDIVESLYNPQDQALVQCIFEGIMGKGMDELISMNAKMIDWDKNIVTVRDSREGGYRSVKVSNRCMSFIERAYKQKVYTAEDTENEKNLVEFEGSIFKNTEWKNTKSKEVSRGNLAKRLSIIKEKYELDEFSANTISISGRIRMAVDLITSQNELTKNEFGIIGKRFNLPKTTVNGYSYYDISKMKNYINERNLEELYNIKLVL